MSSTDRPTPLEKAMKRAAMARLGYQESLSANAHLITLSDRITELEEELQSVGSTMESAIADYGKARDRITELEAQAQESEDCFHHANDALAKQIERNTELEGALREMRLALGGLLDMVQHGGFRPELQKETIEHCEAVWTKHNALADSGEQTTPPGFPSRQDYLDWMDNRVEEGE